MTLKTEYQAISAERLIFRSSVSYATAESRLRSSSQTSHEGFTDKKLSQPTNRESFEAGVHAQVGPHGFMYCNEYNHGRWLPFYQPPTVKVTESNGEKRYLRCNRFILGNPLIAITMLRHDLDAGLSVPVELYLAEEADGGVRIVWYKPASLIAGYEGAKQELVDAAEALSAKLEGLIRWVLRDGAGDEKL